MKKQRKLVGHHSLLDNRKGSALIAALLLVAVSSILGATILFATSTDLQISGNYRRAIQSFYAAEAGLDLRGASLASDAFFPFRDGVDAAAEATGTDWGQ